MNKFSHMGEGGSQDGKLVINGNKYPASANTILMASTLLSSVLRYCDKKYVFLELSIKENRYFVAS